MHNAQYWPCCLPPRLQSPAADASTAHVKLQDPCRSCADLFDPAELLLMCPSSAVAPARVTLISCRWRACHQSACRLAAGIPALDMLTSCWAWSRCCQRGPRRSQKSTRLPATPCSPIWWWPGPTQVCRHGAVCLCGRAPIRSVLQADVAVYNLAWCYVCTGGSTQAAESA